MLPRDVIWALKTLNARKGVFDKKALTRLYISSTNNTLNAKTEHLKAFEILQEYVKKKGSIKYDESESLESYLNFEVTPSNDYSVNFKFYDEKPLTIDESIVDYIQTSEKKFFPGIEEVLVKENNPIYLLKLGKQIKKLINLGEDLFIESKKEYEEKLEEILTAYHNYLELTETFLSFYKHD